MSKIKSRIYFSVWQARKLFKYVCVMIFLFLFFLLQMNIGLRSCSQLWLVFFYYCFPRNFRLPIFAPICSRKTKKKTSVHLSTWYCKEKDLINTDLWPFEWNWTFVWTEKALKFFLCPIVFILVVYFVKTSEELWIYLLLMLLCQLQPWPQDKKKNCTLRSFVSISQRLFLAELDITDTMSPQNLEGISKEIFSVTL